MFRYSDYNNKKPLEFIPNQSIILKRINEDSSFVPRFSLKNIEVMKDVPVNKPLKPTEELLVKAIKYGMIFLINYKGEKDKHFAGHERVIYPLVLGKSSKGKMILRGYHLNGWSVSKSKHIKKVWRLFRTDRILSITFTGSFYRLAPDGYNMYDKGMLGGIIASADFKQLRKNQQTLVDQQKIQNKEEVELGVESKFSTIKAVNLDSILDLNDPMENSHINSIDDLDNLRITFLKSIYGNDYIAMLGSIGKPGNKVKIIEPKGNRNAGTFKVLDSIDGEQLKKLKRVKGNSLYDLYMFDRKISG